MCALSLAAGEKLCSTSTDFCMFHHLSPAFAIRVTRYPLQQIFFLTTSILAYSNIFGRNSSVSFFLDLGIAIGSA